jgi:hypothetical protein
MISEKQFHPISKLIGLFSTEDLNQDIADAKLRKDISLAPSILKLFLIEAVGLIAKLLFNLNTS